jgi:3-hydroxy acid dehydrogenase / malonic semialdehyde reductase
MTTKIALVTGATSGIGRASALVLGQNGYKIIACGRRIERLEELQRQLDTVCPVLPLVFDVRDRAKIDELIASLPEEWQNIDLLVNNAGNAHGLAPIHDGNPLDWEAMIDINVKGLLYMSRAVVKGMIARGKGQIINIGSIAGKEVYPNGNVYCASKFAVDALSQGMRKEWYDKGIRVSQICPGLVETEFSEVRFKGDTQRSEAVYKGYTPLKAGDVADVVLYIAQSPPHVNIADVLLLPADQAASTMVNKKL